MTNTYDALARLTRTELRTSGGTIRNAHGSQYKVASQRTLVGRTNSAVTNRNGYVTTAYDAAGQLTNAWAYQPNGTAVLSEKWSYGYDAAQNLAKRTNNVTVETFTVNALNQLTAIPDSTPTYDRPGNLTSRAFSYTYDPENQLTRVATDTVTTPSGSRFRVDFVYDGQWRLRVRKDYVWGAGDWSQSNETRYLYDGLRIVQERNGSNLPTVSYTRGRDLSGSLEGAGGIGGLLARSHGYSGGSWGSHNFYHADGNENVTALVNSGGTLQASYKYDPYGRYLGEDGALAATNGMRFSSKPWVGFAGSATNGLSYYGFRFYDPYLQRWPNQDPIAERAGINVYGFVGNNPLTYVDPLGLQWLGGLCRFACEVGARPPVVGTLTPPEGAIQNAFRPGSWGRIDPQTGTFQECWRMDKGTPGQPGWRGIDHFHYWGSPDHMLPPLPPFQWFTVPPVNAPPAIIIAPPGVKPPPGFIPITPPTPPKPLPPGTVVA